MASSYRPNALILSLLLPLALVNAGTADVVHSDLSLKSVAFGSCNKPSKPQPLWSSIESLAPDVFVWTGDAFYTNGSELEDLHEAIELQNSRVEYTHFLTHAKLPVIGTIDDHDFGVNDGGKETLKRNERIDAFVGFLKFANSLAGGNGSESLSARLADPSRDGLYSLHTFGKPPRQTKVILLDARTHRDPYLFYLPHWLMRHKIPLISRLYAPVNTVLRVLSASVHTCLRRLAGLDFQKDLDVLGETQWEWLEETLRESPASFHVIVSSVQVWTSNPFVESWGHFPSARLRLAQLLNKHRPKGLIFLSGDVHFAELIKGVSDDHIVEVTSSGMTHFATGRAGLSSMVAAVIRHFHSHRPHPGAEFSTGINFGSLEFEWGEEEEEGEGRGRVEGTGCSGASSLMRTQVRDVKGDPVLTSVTCSESEGPGAGDTIDWVSLHAMRDLGQGMEKFVLSVIVGGLVCALSLFPALRCLGRWFR